MLILALWPYITFSQIIISKKPENPRKFFPIVTTSNVASIYYDDAENVLIKKSADFLAGDIEKVSGRKPVVNTTDKKLGNNIILVGTVGNNPLIEKLVAQKKLNTAPLKGQWEHFIIQTVHQPFDGVKEALVIVGSDRRGAAYGVFTLSKEMGVSPWYWWADVPVKKSDEIYLEECQYVSDGPAVKYRGIFINDERPSLVKWAYDNYGGFNHQFYEKVYELILRNKGNFLWPAMWLGNKLFSPAFADDDPENQKLADDYGIVMSTSHHEPMMRAHTEWYRYNGGEWDYTKNKEKLQEFWRGGIKRMGDYESVITVGMRGDGDRSMPGGTQVKLMQSIIDDQREIIADVTGKPAEETLQAWTVYKEVQKYYDEGIRMPDDITIVFSDDNWGNIRCLPKKEDLNRRGGFGIYYHFDYVGGPVSYKWANVTQIERVWEQMHMAYQWGARKLWIVNVGDIKPHELPTSFFLDYAWNPEAIKAEDIPGYYVAWAKQQFGDKYAHEIGKILSLYTKYNARRIPEMLEAGTYSVENYREADKVVSDYNQLCQQAKIIYDKLPDAYKSAFYELVLFPVETCSNLNEMYVNAAKNKFYVNWGAPRSANYYADKTKELFFKDAELHKYFHEDLENGKWNHMFEQTHIGYTNWYSPPVDNMPPVAYTHTTGNSADLGFHVEYGTNYYVGGICWDGLDWRYHNKMQHFDPLNDQDYYIEIFNKGDEDLSYQLKPKQDWIKLSKEQGTIQTDEKVYVTIDWTKAPKGRATGEIIISGAGSEYSVEVPIRNDLPKESGFIENNGVVSIEAAHFDKAINTEDVKWITLPNLGRTGSSVTIAPTNAERQVPDNDPAHLEYTFSIFDSTHVELLTYVSPTDNFKREEGLKFAVSIDHEKPQIVNMHEGADWESLRKRVGDHIAILTTKHGNLMPGKHILKVWIVDPGVVFQKFVFDLKQTKSKHIEPANEWNRTPNNDGGVKPSYLGPPESLYLEVSK